MKKLLLLLLLAAPAALPAQITMSNFNASVGSSTTLTFDVRWTPVTGKVWSDTVWVFVDYNVRGTMKRLPLSGGSLTKPSWSGASVTKIDDNPNGVWVVGNARTESSFSATVQLHTATADFHGLCVYAINYPPVGHYESVDSIRFTGTPPFELKFASDALDTILQREDALHTYTYKFISSEGPTSFTDASKAPGVFKCKTPNSYTLTATASVCADMTQFVLDGTEAGATYLLYKGNEPAATLTGNGNPGTFPGTFGAGAYSVQAVGSQAFCAATVTGTYKFDDPLPANPVVGPAAGRCDAGTVTLTASSPGAVIDWYTTILGGTAALSGSNSYTTPSLTTNTLYYAVARTAAGCLSRTRTPVLAMVGTPAITRQPGSKGICSGTKTRLDVLADRATAYQWYNGNTAITSEGGNYYYTTGALTSPVTYKVTVANGACSVTSDAAVVSITTNGCGENCTPPEATVNFNAFNPCSGAANGTSWYLTDTRVGGNNETYKVRKMEDGKIWMVQDLKYGNCIDTRLEGTEYGTLSGSCRTAVPACVAAGAGYMYDWFLALAGTSTPCTGASDDCRGLCPAGWHVPTGYGTDADFDGLYPTLKASSSESRAWSICFACGLGIFYGTGYLNANYAAFWHSSSINPAHDGYIIMQLVGIADQLYQMEGGYGKDGAAFVRCVMND
jgi:uncharacterized protein (TIGR02145 family)